MEPKLNRGAMSSLPFYQIEGTAATMQEKVKNPGGAGFEREPEERMAAGQATRGRKRLGH